MCFGSYKKDWCELALKNETGKNDGKSTFDSVEEKRRKRDIFEWEGIQVYFSTAILFTILYFLMNNIWQEVRSQSRQPAKNPHKDVVGFKITTRPYWAKS